VEKFIEELWEEIADFFEDFYESLTGKHEDKVSTKTAVVNGVAVKVRPAYIFAERIDNLLKLIFGLSITISAFTASFLGFASLSDLVDVLIKSLWGRAIMIFLGLSYIVISIWKLLHLFTGKAAK
jgi:hypothetical protein